MAKDAGQPRRDSDFNVLTNCENCGAELATAARDSGKKATCPECGTSLTIPTAEQAAARRQALAKGRPAEKNLRLREDAPNGKAAPAPAPHNRPARALSLSADVRHRTRAKLVGWFRRVVIVIFAFVVVNVFEASFASLLVRAPGDLHAAIGWLGEAIRSVPGSLTNLGVQRPLEIGLLTPLERFVLGLGMLVYLTRLVVRTKLLDAVYVTTERWAERTVTGLGFHFLTLLVQAGLLAWAASATRLPSASDGLTCGIIATLLLFSAAWLATLHLVAGNEYPELTSWMIIDLTCGLLIMVVVLWPGVTQLWSRAGATAVLLLANSVAALHIGASFVFARRPRRWWWHKPLSIVASMIVVFLVALLLACQR